MEGHTSGTMIVDGQGRRVGLVWGGVLAGGSRVRVGHHAGARHRQPAEVRV